MGQGHYCGVVWGEMGDVEHPLFAPRLRGTLALDSKGETYNLRDACGGHGIEHDGEDTDDGERTYWCGAQVCADLSGAWRDGPCATTSPVADLATLYAEEIVAARAKWKAFRAWCVKHAKYDPGKGRMLLVVGYD